MHTARPSLLLLTAAISASCAAATAVPERAPAGEQKTISEVEINAGQKIEAFQARIDTKAALDAALLLSQPDTATDREARLQVRDQRVALWGRLLTAIDAKIDPKFDPDFEPPMRVTVAPEDYPVPQDPREIYFVSIDTLKDPEMRKRYAEKEEQLARDTEFLNAQRRIYRTGQRVTELAKEYFTTVFVRSPKSVATVEQCAEAGHWNAARLEQVRSWVRPAH